MKKTILSLAFVAMGVAAFAQKPAAGDKTAEFNLNFQTGTSGVAYGLGATALAGTPELRLRYFMADDMAIRLKIGMGMGTTTAQQTATIAGAEVTAETKTNSGFGLALTPGIEKHFAGSTKLSPYVGAELPIGFGTGATVEVSNGDNAAGTPTGSGDSYKSEGGSQFNLGLRLVLGADYYIADGLYLGVEGGLGIFGMGSTGDATVNSTTSTVKAPEIKTPGGSTFSLFGAMAGTVRLGYKF
ncbi:MAG: hypothetical protein V4651_02740 [Bacteroidota bacterium]